MVKVVVLAVMSRKGGVGKTTTTVALAELIARTRPDLRPVVIDLDAHGDDGTGDATTWAAIAKGAGDPLSTPVVEQPADVSAVQLPRWIRQRYRDRLVLLDCPPAAGGSQAHESAVEIVAELGGVVIVPTTPEVIDATSGFATVQGVRADVAVALLIVRTEANTIRTETIRPDLERALASATLMCAPRVMTAEVPKRAEVGREVLAPIGDTSLLLNLYFPVLNELLDVPGPNP